MWQPAPQHVQHLILVGAAGLSEESDRITQFRSTWKGAVANFMWDRNLTPQKIVRGIGPWGPALVRKYAGVRFGTYTSRNMLSEQKSKLFSDYLFHTLAGRASGELCLKYIFSLGAFARSPHITRGGAQEARKRCLSVPTFFAFLRGDILSFWTTLQDSILLSYMHVVISCPDLL